MLVTSTKIIKINNKKMILFYRKTTCILDFSHTQKIVDSEHSFYATSYIKTHGKSSVCSVRVEENKSDIAWVTTSTSTAKECRQCDDEY